MTILGLSLYTWFHVVLSLVMLVAGFVVAKDLLRSQISPGWMATFLATGVLTSATGFGFPFVKFLPSHAFGVLSLILLAVTVYARWGAQLSGRWLTAYGTTLAIAIYLDAFVALVQSFLKIPALHELVPSDKSPGFAIGQALLLVIFLALGIAAVRGLRRAA